MTDTSNTGLGRYVVLAHTRADGTHCDLMLEAKGTLVTWALDNLELLVNSPEAQGRRLPDHRTAYLEYEGPISGGRGSVKRIAAGSILKLDRDDCRVCAVLAGNLAGTLTAEHLHEDTWRLTFLKESGQ